MQQPQKKPTRAEIEREFWYRGKLFFKLKPIQSRLKAAFQACKTFLFVSLVARQTGKSFTWFLTCIEVCLTQPNARVRYATAFHDDLTEFIIPIAETIFEDCPSDIKPKYHKQGSKWIFPSTKAELKLIGLDINPDGVRGNALHLIVIDEAGFVAKLSYVVSIIIAMLRHRPQLRVVMSSSAPETPDHDYWSYVDKARLEGGIFEATIYDDETCTEETIERIAKEYGGKESTGFRRECLNERIVDAELAIVPEWQTKLHARELEHDEYYQYYHRYTAMDLGVVDFTAILYGYYDFRKATLYVASEDSIRGPTMTTDKVGDLVRKKEKQLWGLPEKPEEHPKIQLRIADNNNPQMLQDLAILYKIPFIPTSKDELPAMINELRLWVKQGRVVVNPACKMLIGCLEGGVYNDKKEKREFAKSKVYGHYDHLAALVYMVRNVNQHANPIPAHFGVSAHTHFIREDRKETPEAEKVWSGVLGKKFVTRK